MSEVVTQPVPDATLREKVDLLEAEMRKHPAVDIPVKHYFATGLYVREITIPAGVVAVGKIHKTQHINVLSKGEVTMVTETGSLRVQAPYTWVVAPGKKAAAYAHTETVWSSICVNPTDERDLDTLEAALISPQYLDELEGAPSWALLPQP
jgi:hypothetical protein